MYSKRSIYFVFFIFCTLGINNPFDAIELGQEEILKPFLHKTDSEEVIQTYKTKLLRFFNYELNANQKPELALKEIATLSSKALKSEFKKDTKEEIIKLIQNLLIVNKFKTDNADAIKTDFKKFYLNYRIKKTQYDLNTIDLVSGEMNKFIHDLTVDTIKEALDTFPTTNPHILKPEKTGNDIGLEILTPSTKSFIFKVLSEYLPLLESQGNEFYMEFLNFRSNAVKKTKELLKQCIVIAFEPNRKYKREEENLMLQKLISLIEFQRLISDRESAYDYIFQVGMKLTSEHLEWVSEHGYLYNELMIYLVGTFAQTSNVNHWKMGKRLFVSYFYEIKETETLSQEYAQFITNKYKKDGLKLNGEVFKLHPNMVRTYVLDVIHSSLFLEREIINQKDLIEVFSKFRTLIADVIPQEYIFFLNLRGTFLKSDRLWVKTKDPNFKYDNLHHSAYDSFLHCVQYYFREYLWAIPNINKPGAMYLDYINTLWSWKNGYLTGRKKWEPLSEHFNININENYAFFMLLNIVENTEDLENVSIKFQDFSKLSNYIISLYTLEKNPRRLLSFIRQNYFTLEGLNYSNLAKVTLNQYFIGGYLKYVSNENSQNAEYQ